MEASAAAPADTSVRDRYAAFALADGHEDLTGASCANSITGETIDLLALLKDTEHGNQDGVIVTDDPIVADACNTMPAFEAAEVPDSFDPPAPDTGDALPEDLDRLLKDDLVDLAEARDLPAAGTKAELADRLRAWQERQVSGAEPTGAESAALQAEQFSEHANDQTAGDGGNGGDE